MTQKIFKKITTFFIACLMVTSVFAADGEYVFEAANLHITIPYVVQPDLIEAGDTFTVRIVDSASYTVVSSEFDPSFTDDGWIRAGDHVYTITITQEMVDANDLPRCSIIGEIKPIVEGNGAPPPNEDFGINVEGKVLGDCEGKDVDYDRDPPMTIEPDLQNNLVEVVDYQIGPDPDYAGVYHGQPWWDPMTFEFTFEKVPCPADENIEVDMVHYMLPDSVVVRSYFSRIDTGEEGYCYIQIERGFEYDKIEVDRDGDGRPDRDADGNIIKVDDTQNPPVVVQHEWGHRSISHYYSRLLQDKFNTIESDGWSSISWNRANKLSGQIFLQEFSRMTNEITTEHRAQQEAFDAPVEEGGVDHIGVDWSGFDTNGGDIPLMTPPVPWVAP